MTKSQIKAELRREAKKDLPASFYLKKECRYALLEYDEPTKFWSSVDHKRFFFLLVAEAL